MASVKRAGTGTKSKPTVNNEEDFVGEVKRNLKKRGAFSEGIAESELQSEILQAPGDTVWVWNRSKGEFHIPPVSFKPQDIEMADITVFQVNEVKPFEKDELMNKRFKQCLMDGKLQIVSEEDAKKIKTEGERKLKKSTGGNKSGLAQSGLPNSLSAALAYVMQSEDIDELEAFAQDEEREAVQAVIEERIAELEEGEFQD